MLEDILCLLSHKRVGVLCILGLMSMTRVCPSSPGAVENNHRFSHVHRVPAAEIHLDVSLLTSEKYKSVSLLPLPEPLHLFIGYLCVVSHLGYSLEEMDFNPSSLLLLRL